MRVIIVFEKRGNMKKDSLAAVFIKYNQYNKSKEECGSYKAQW